MNVVVTGGGTTAPIDDVRTITNVSSGRFSAAIAEAACRKGHGLARPRPLGPASPGPLGPVRPRHRRPRRRARPASPAARRLESVSGTGCTSSRCARERSPTTPRRCEHLLTTQPIDVAFLAMAVSDYEPIPSPASSSSGRTICSSVATGPPR